MIFPVRSNGLPGWERMTDVKTSVDNRQKRERINHSLHLGSNLYQRFRWSGSLETSAFDSRKAAQQNESLQNLLRINWMCSHRLCFDRVWSGKSWLWKGLVCDPSTLHPTVQLGLLPSYQDGDLHLDFAPWELSQEGRVRAHLLHRGSQNGSFFSEHLVIYTAQGAKLSSGVWGWKGYHFNTSLPVTPQATQKSSAYCKWPFCMQPGNFW